MKLKNTSLVLTAATLGGLSSAQAAVSIIFEQAGLDVTATLSGFIDVTGLGNFGPSDGVNDTDVAETSQTHFYTDKIGADERWADGIATATGLNTFPTIGLTYTFGFANRSLHLPLNSGALNPVFSIPAESQYIWRNRTLAGIGLGALTTDPLLVWRNPNVTPASGEIYYSLANPVPEPSSALLLLGASCLLTLRKRR